MINFFAELASTCTHARAVKLPIFTRALRIGEISIQLPRRDAEVAQERYQLLVHCTPWPGEPRWMKSRSESFIEIFQTRTPFETHANAM